MPLYPFKNQKTGEVRDVFFGMNDNKEYKGEDGAEEGDWKRVFSAPQLATTGIALDPFSQKSFLKKTENVKTYGEAWKISKEMSEMRSSKLGAPDPQKEAAEKKFYKPKS